MAKPATVISKKLAEIDERIKLRKQSDLRFTISTSKSLLSFARAYESARKNGLTKKDVMKVDAALEKALAV